MSVFKQKNSIASVEFKKFKGIDRNAPHRETNAAYDMSNFRILPDGSLQKRCGFSLMGALNQPVRGLWAGKLDGEDIGFFVYGSMVARITTNPKLLTMVGNVKTKSGNANFVLFNDRLYLFDGSYVYNVTSSGPSVVEGYAPLYGKDWPVGQKGEVNEPLNLASTHIRMTYVVNEPFIYLCVDHVISSIDAVYVNDKLISDQSRYYFDRELMCVCVTQLNVGDRVSLFLTVDESEINKSDLLSCNGAASFGDYNDNILFLWGGEKKNVVFASCAIDNDSLEEVKKVYSKTLPLYIPADAAFTLPTQEKRITAVCRQYDRLLIFTENETWMAHISASPQRKLDAVMVNPTYGCTSFGGAVECANEPVCVSDGAVLRWTSDTDELNECNAYNISSQVESMLPDSFFKNALLVNDKKRSEIFFSDPTDPTGNLWIYNYAIKDWYKFDGIGAKLIFLCGESLGFVSQNTVFLFDEAMTKDRRSDSGTQVITAFYESHPTDLSVPGNKKRLCGMTLNADLAGKDISIRYLSQGQIIRLLKISNEKFFPVSFIKRLNSRRFCYMNLRLISDSNATQRIYSTGVWVKP